MNDWLSNGTITVIGRHTQASNAVFVVECVRDDATCRAIYKPAAGERSLWDFPDAVLAQREVAAYAVAQALGFTFVPPTIWREDAPAGPGSLQLWIDDADVADVAVVTELPSGWLSVLDAELQDGTAVQVAHIDSDELRALALFDAVVNNADRKAGHILRGPDQGMWAVDHGVTFHAEPKLRTVLWGFAGEEIPTALLDRVSPSLAQLPEVVAAIDEREIDALLRRIEELQRSRTFPPPSPEWPAIPWPIF